MGTLLCDTNTVEVNYDLSVEDAVRRGVRGVAEREISSKCFASDRKGVAEVTIEFSPFTPTGSFWSFWFPSFRRRAALRDLEQRGMRPAELHEILAFCEKNPDSAAWRGCSLVALGSTAENWFRWNYSPYVYPCASGNWSLDLVGFGVDLIANTCVLAGVRK